MRFLRISIILFSIIIFLSLVTTLTIPSILSSHTGQNLFQDLINDRIPGKIQFQTLELHWFKPSLITGLKLHDDHDNQILSIEELKIDNGLWKLLTSTRPQPVLSITGMNAFLISDTAGTTNLERALFYSSFEKPFLNLLSPIELKECQILSEIHGKTVIGSASGITVQEGLEGSFSLEGNFSSKPSILFSAKNLPALILDQIVSIAKPAYKGIVSETLGKKIDIDFTLKESKWDFDLVSSNAKGNAEGRWIDDGLLLTKPGEIDFDLTPAAFKILTGLNDPLLKPAQVEIEILGLDTLHDDFKAIVTLSSLKSLNFDFSEIKADILPSSIGLTGQGNNIKFYTHLKMEGSKTILDPLKWIDQLGDMELKIETKDQLTVKGSGKISHEGLIFDFNASSPHFTLEEGQLISHSPLPWELVSHSRWNEIKLNGKLTFEKLESKEISITDFKAPWSIEGKKELFFTHYEGVVNRSGSLKGDFLALSTSSKFSIDLSDFPLALISPISSLIPSAGNIHLKGETTWGGNGDLKYQIATTDFDLGGKIKFLNFESLTLDGEETKLDLHMSKERFKALTHNQFSSDKSVKGSFVLTRLDLKKPLQNSGIEIKFSLLPSQFIYLANGQLINLQGFQGHFSSLDLTKTIDFAIHEAQNAGIIDLKGSLSDLFSDVPTLLVNGDVSSFPTSFIAALVPPRLEMGRKIEALLGSKFSADIHADLKKGAGPLTFHLKGKAVDLNFDGRVKDKILYLNQPLAASLQLTPEVNEQILAELVPLLNSATRSEKPLLITLSPENFQFPLNNINLNSLQIFKGEIELNKIYFNRQGKIAEVLSLLNVKSPPEFSVWFTPLYFSLANGNLYLKRLDLLVADHFPLATWGNIDFETEQVNMQVGLTGKSLFSSLGISGLPQNYMLSLPLRGSLSNPKLDKSAIATKLTGLAALMTTTPQGMLIGSLLDLAANKMSGPVPEPTTSPLPWDTSSPQGKLDEADSHDDRPLKGIQKEAKKWLDNIFGK